MPYVMKHSHSVDFMNQDKVELDFIIDELNKAGNIETALRDDILKNIKTLIGSQEVQWILRNGVARLSEYIVHRYKFKNYPRLKKLDPFPLHLLIEPTSICNLRCTMCSQSDESFQTKEYLGMMDIDFFKRLVDQAVENDCKALTLASRGEPTLHKNFGEMLLYCNNKFLELKINTNAVSLDDELSQQILEAGVDIVVFSVDSYFKEQYEEIRIGGNFETVLQNIKRFSKLKLSKDDYRKTATRVHGVYLGKEQSKKDFFDFWKDIVDIVSFTDVVPRWDAYNNAPMNYSKPCEYLWERMYVWHDGICNPCDYDYKSKLKVGNAKKTLLMDIWTGEAYNKYRKMFLQGDRKLLSPCNRCNVY